MKEVTGSLASDIALENQRRNEKVHEEHKQENTTAHDINQELYMSIQALDKYLTIITLSKSL